MNQKSLEFIQALKDHADILSKYLEEHPEALARIVSELPTHQEPKKVRSFCNICKHDVYEDVPFTIDGGGRIVHYKCYTDVEYNPKLVTVEDALSKIIRGMRDPEAYYSEDIAKAAIEFFKARMPKPMPDNCSAPNTFWDGYNQALKDVRQALFGEA